MHYKSFEELYGKETTENHRPSLKNTKSKKKDKTKSTRAKHIMPFCPSAARTKNVGITVNCVECEKPRLLFSAKKLSEKNKTTLRRFLDTIFYTCGMSFYNTCDLAMAVSPKQPDDDAENDDDTENYNEEADNQEIADVEDNEENEWNEPEDSDNEEEPDNEEEEESGEKVPEKEEDSIREIFSKVFVNDSWSCASQVEKPYYSASIFPDVCLECGSLDVTRVTKGEHPHCSVCSSNTNISKKRLR